MLDLRRKPQVGVCLRDCTPGQGHVATALPTHVILMAQPARLGADHTGFVWDLDAALTEAEYLCVVFLASRKGHHRRNKQNRCNGQP